MTKETFEEAQDLLTKIDKLKNGIYILKKNQGFSHLGPIVNIHVDGQKIEASTELLKNLIFQLLDAYCAKKIELEQKFAAL